MRKPIPSYLKLHGERAPRQPSELDDFAALENACRAFGEATGWNLEHAPNLEHDKNCSLMWSAPVNPGVGTSLGHLRIVLSRQKSSRTVGRIELAAARNLAGALAELWHDLSATRRALREREAELATGVALVAHRDEPGQLTDRLEGVLRAGAQSVGCQAAALYLLDAGTSELKLRSSWGLPSVRFLDPPRSLKPAIADLEALLGHAVVLSDPRLRELWHAPEPFTAAICLPVSSATMPLGTVWFFCQEERDFTERETELLEIVAGRIASDLERALLLGEVTSLRRRTAELPEFEPEQLEPVRSEPAQFQPALSEPSQLREAHLPMPALLDGWDVAGAIRPAEALGGSFYDWCTPAGGGLAITVGQSCADGVAGALVASAARAAARALAHRRQSPGRGLEILNSTLWSAAAGDQATAAFRAHLDQASGTVSFAAAGGLTVLAVSDSSWRWCKCTSEPLGTQESISLRSKKWKAAPGETLVVYGSRALLKSTAAEREAIAAAVAEAIRAGADASADAEMPAEGPAKIMAERVLARLDECLGEGGRQSSVALIVRRAAARRAAPAG